MGAVVVVIGVLVVLAVVVVVFVRAVFGGSTFSRQRARDRDLPSGPPGPRADAHPGTREWPNAGPWGRGGGQWGPGGSP